MFQFMQVDSNQEKKIGKMRVTNHIYVTLVDLMNSNNNLLSQLVCVVGPEKGLTLIYFHQKCPRKAVYSYI